MTILLIGLDQFTKYYILDTYPFGTSIPVIEGFFNIVHVRNTGAAFGFMADGPLLFRQVFFLLIPVLFSGWILWMLVKTRKGPLLASVTYALILAGAVGNLLNRFILGHVVDFLMFYWKDESNHFPAFNVADICISIAAFLLLCDFFITHNKKQHS